MSEIKFNSQICTSRSQSERLLALGLKKETADMYYQKLNDKWNPFVGQPLSYDGLRGTYLIPAWSLHRLLMMATTKRKCLLIRCEADLFDAVIDRIEYAIKEGYFNKEYLV